MATRTSNRRKQARSLPKGTWREVGRLRSIPGDWWAWSFLPLCLIYVVIVLTHFDHLVVNIYGSSDTSAPLVLAEQFGERAGGHVVSSNYPWDATLIFALATKWLPAHRAIWELGPFLLGLLSIALMSWAALRVAGRWGAALTAVILLCAGPTLLELMFWLTNHTPTWYSLAVLGAFLVLLTDRKMSIGWLPLTILTLCVGVVVGISVATDKELITGGLVPLVLAGVGTWVMTRTALAARAMWFALAAAVATGVGAVVTTSIMRSEGVTTNGYEVKFAVLEAISTNVKVWWQSVAMLGNGNFFGEAIKFTTAIALICAALSVGTVLLIPRFAWRHVSSQRSDQKAVDEQLNIYVIFWTASVVCLSVGFVFSSAPIFPYTTEDLGYLVGLIYAVAAMLPLLARRSVAIRAIVVAGTLVFLLGSMIALGHSNSIKAPPSARGPSPEVAEDVARVAERMHATDGYGLYWDAAAITWRSNFRVLVAPIVGCAGSQGLCPGPNGYIEAWYNHTPPHRTFLLTDSSVLAWGPPVTLGRAVATYHFGTVTMYVYNYNIIEKLF